ncbi:MAG: diadenylate cyclase [Planctomycetota bacterium]
MSSTLALLAQVLPDAALPFVRDEPERARDIISAVIEIGLLSWLFYLLLRFLHGKAGLAVLKGILITSLSIVVGLFALFFLMGIRFPRLLVAGTYMLPFLIVMLVVLFQPELRRGFLRLSAAGRLGGRGAPGQLADVCAALRSLARRHVGALVVFEQQTGIKGLQDTGVPLDSSLSGALLESIFYPKSPLHDGAVIVRNDRIVAACCMLPLTERENLPIELGTRHRAALGVTEESDAVAVVVSEETGRIAVVHGGQLHAVDDPTRLEDVLAGYLEGRAALDEEEVEA